jgi:hypothetical protein
MKKRKEVRRMAKLKNSFEFVRKEFFPRWDKKKEWFVKKVAELAEGLQGICVKKDKTILIFYLPHNENSLYWLLVHEICHAISTDLHGRKWKNRMVRASESAQKKGNKELSNMILHDLKELKKRGEKKGGEVNGMYL